MILGKRTILCCLLVLALLNIVFRYPIGVSHELGADTTFVHSLTASIAQEGRAAWILHPFSYFGLYALSYPSQLRTHGIDNAPVRMAYCRCRVLECVHFCEDNSQGRSIRSSRRTPFPSSSFLHQRHILDCFHSRIRCRPATCVPGSPR